MKKTLSIFSILFTLLLLASCNMDATNGIFQSVLMSQTTITEPLSQIIDYNALTKEYYMISDNGLIKFSTTGYQTLVPYTSIPNIQYGFKNGTDIYLMSDYADTQGPIINKYYKYDGTNVNDVVLNIADGYKLISIDNNNKIYLNNKNDKKLVYGNFTFPNITAGAEILDYSAVAKLKTGIEVRNSLVLLLTTDSTSNQPDYVYYNYIIKSDGKAYVIHGLENSDTTIVSGAIQNGDDNNWYITAFNNSSDISNNEVIVYSLAFDGVNNRFNATKKFGTGVSSKDRDIVIGKKGSYYFHLAGRAPLFHFTDGSTTISQTIVNNLSSSIDFVYITPDPTGDIIATSNKGFYRLTNPSSPTGFVRINSL